MNERAELGDMLIQACHKLHEAAGAVDYLGRPEYAKEFAALATSIRSRMFQLEDEVTAP